MLLDRVLAGALVLWAALCLGATTIAIVALTSASAHPCEPAQCRSPQLAVSVAGSLDLTGYAVVVAVISVITALVPALLGTIVALWGHGRARFGASAVWFALGFGAFSAWSPVPVLAWIIPTVGLAGLFWLLAGFPGLAPNPRWTAIPAGLLSVWAVITFGVPSVAGAIARAEAPWFQLIGPVFIAGTLAIVVGKAIAYRSAPPSTRRWYRILGVAAAIMVATGIGGAVLAFLPDPQLGSAASTIGSLVSNLATAVLFAVLAAASLRDGGYGVRPALNHVLFGAILLGVAVIAYAVTVGLVSTAAAGWVPPAVAAIVTALVLAAVFSRLARTIDRLVYGASSEPGALVAALTVELAATTDPDDAVPAVLRRLLERLHLPYAALELADGERIEAGVSQDGVPHATLDLPLELGLLTVGLRPGQPRLARRDALALRASAAPLQAALAARRLATAAAEAGRGLATVREAERRTLRRQLHDEVGPDLAIAKFRVSAARRDLLDEPELATAHLEGAARALSLGLDRVRAISRELRPPALDQGGLVPALRRVAEESGLRFDGPAEPSRPIPDAVEIVLYRVGAEAITNAVRHGGAASVRVSVDDAERWTELAIADDGSGLPDPYLAGVGITSMRERAGELGGTVSLDRSDAGGVLVTCRVPV